MYRFFRSIGRDRVSIPVSHPDFTQPTLDRDSNYRMELPPSIQVMVEISNLKAVRAITDAVYQNLIDAGGIPGPLSTVKMPYRHPTESWLDQVEIDDPIVLQGNPIYDDPRIFRQPTTFIPGEVVELDPIGTTRPEKDAIWKKMPPIPPPPCVCVVKYEAAKVDAKGSGRWLDLFV